LEYSDTIIKPQSWTEKMLELKQLCEAIAGVTFSNALFNLYRDDKDSVA
jgi:alkylated DNA repair dioxygenase AlkB